MTALQTLGLVVLLIVIIALVATGMVVLDWATHR